MILLGEAQKKMLKKTMLSSWTWSRVDRQRKKPTCRTWRNMRTKHPWDRDRIGGGGYWNVSKLLDLHWVLRKNKFKIKCWEKNTNVGPPCTHGARAHLHNRPGQTATGLLSDLISTRARRSWPEFQISLRGSRVFSQKPPVCSYKKSYSSLYKHPR